MTSLSTPGWPAQPPSHGRVTLRPSNESDAPMVRELAQDPYIPLIGTIPANASPQQAGAWIEAQLAKHAAGTVFPFTIAHSGTDLALGHCGLWMGAIAAGRTSVGYAIAPSHRGHGYAADALIALTAFAWTVPGIHRLEAYVEPWNAASARTAERAGYAFEGVLRSHQEIGGTRRDMALYAAINPSSG